MIERRRRDRRDLPALPETLDRLLTDSFNQQQQKALREVWGLNARTLAEVQQIVTGQYLLLRRGLALLFVLFLGIGLVTVRNLKTAGDAADRARTVARNIAAVQHHLLVSQKASTATRVSTVSQRCDLTHLILGVLVRVHDEQDAAPFQASLQTCQKQLASVKKINAETPSP